METARAADRALLSQVQYSYRIARDKRTAVPMANPQAVALIRSGREPVTAAA